MKMIFTVIGGCFGRPFNGPVKPFDVVSEVCGWVLLGSEAEISDEDESIISGSVVADAAVLCDAELLDDRVVWDSRVRFRLGDECSEADVDVI